MKRNSTAKEVIKADFNADWLASPSLFDHLDAEWIEIIVFFVFHAPVKESSARGKSLKDFGWGEKKGSADLKLLKKRLIRYAGMKPEQFVAVDSRKDLCLALSDNNLLDFPKDYRTIRLSYIKGKEGVCEGLCRHIRNSFAHGRLAFYKNGGETYIALEDINIAHDVTSRMLLSKTVLMKWMKIIQDGPFKSEEELDAELRRFEKRRSTKKEGK